MARFIIYGILIYLLYLGLRTLLTKFQSFKNIFGNTPQNTKKSKYSKKDINNIEDADYEEIKKS
jgi:hypothetical protein